MKSENVEPGNMTSEDRARAGQKPPWRREERRLEAERLFPGACRDPPSPPLPLPWEQLTLVFPAR